MLPMCFRNWLKQYPGAQVVISEDQSKKVEEGYNFRNGQTVSGDNDEYLHIEILEINVGENKQ